MTTETSFEDNIIDRSKHVMFGGATGFEDWVEEGVDWSGASGVMTIAPSGGAAVITLNVAALGSQGISFTWDPTYQNEEGVAVGATRIRPQIDEATKEALTFPAAPAPLALVYDLLVTPTGQPQRVYAWGTFTIYPGVGD